MSAGWPARIKQPAPLTDFSQYATSPVRRAYCYAELAVSSPAPILTAPTHGGMARLSGVDEYRNGRPTKGGGHQSEY